ncbi:Homeobox-leucine zipper protein HOX3 [Vitis vinifera]|uniref:Homeobox-leucine zipper protein HOX3 n=1 Tax=Vitis vinifera TaxID=29760 RepID=A0A438JUF2_VITVI|nr:Homeobox-leucine zipper protein HOX3 [Vitis vinifera]
MDVIPMRSSSLELTISVPGFTSSPSLPSSAGEGVCGVRDLDINQVPLGAEEEWTTGSMEDEEESGNGGPPRKKLRLSKDQSRLLEESFRQNHTLNPKQKEALAMQLKLRPRQVEVWFQNRRARFGAKVELSTGIPKKEKRITCANGNASTNPNPLSVSVGRIQIISHCSIGGRRLASWQPLKEGDTDTLLGHIGRGYNEMGWPHLTSDHREKNIPIHKGFNDVGVYNSDVVGSKLKQTEMECEYLKRWFGSLTEQNRRLQREVEELRAMKVAPPTVISPHSCEPLPASTLTMCPRCERVTTTSLGKDPTNRTTSPTLSSKLPTALHSRHSSAAC